MASGKNILIVVLMAMVWLPFELCSQSYTGYTLYSPNNGRNTYLIDMNKTVVHSWSHTKSGGYTCYLLADGSVMRPAMSTNSSLAGGGEAGVVQRVAWNGTLLWEYTYSSATVRSHHDIEPMPNGNVLLIAWEVKTAAQAVAAGYKTNTALWPDHIVEIQPVGTTGGTIVWQWHAWDHLVQEFKSTASNYGVVKEHPELFNINAGGAQGDWSHMNGISYNPELDQIVVSSHTQNEIYVIDHSTTTAEAATHAGGKSGRGGDILYRWGKASNYGVTGADVFDVVHSATWVPAGIPGAGHIMAFNNRSMQSTSMVVELAPPNDGTGKYLLTAGTSYAPASPAWSYTAAGFSAFHLGGCQRLPNGNTLITQSLVGRMFEVDAAGTVLWNYQPGGEIVKALRYAPAYINLSTLGVGSTGSALPSDFRLEQNFPNPFNPSTTIAYAVPHASFVDLEIVTMLGQTVATLVSENKNAGEYSISFNAARFPSGMYLCRMKAGEFTAVKKMILAK